MIGLRDLAKATGFSIGTISRALRHDPSISRATRECILREARKVGYEANPYFGQVMSALRRRDEKICRGNIGIIWLDKSPEKSGDRRLFQIRSGVRERAGELGYNVDEFCRSDQSPDSLRKILLNRGIHGVLIACPSSSLSKAYFRFNMKNFAAVTLGGGLAYPKLHSVRFDYSQALQVALHHIRHTFRAGVAAIWNFKTDRRAQHAARAAFLTHHMGGALLAQQLFLDCKELSPRKTPRLFKKMEIRCVIVESSVQLPGWFHEIIPANHIIWLRDPRPEKFFAWIDTRNELLGKWGVDLLATQLLRNEYGIPEICKTLLIPPQWMRGMKKNDEPPVPQ